MPACQGNQRSEVTPDQKTDDVAMECDETPSPMNIEEDSGSGKSNSIDSVSAMEVDDDDHDRCEMQVEESLMEIDN
uniref:Uncharacterized protein n=1 Tax=Bracon brevicornis TaxID=1563983 RepID=A0A6V7LP91_9HYME